MNDLIKKIYIPVRQDILWHRILDVIGWVLSIGSLFLFPLTFTLYFGVIQRVVFYIVYGNDKRRWVKSDSEEDVNLTKKDNKDPWQISAAKFCVDNSETGFSQDDLRKFIKKNYSVSDGHIEQFIEEELNFPLGSKFSRNGRNGLWIPTLELVSKITDYEELREARKNSKNAFWLSIIAIMISLITLLKN